MMRLSELLFGRSLVIVGFLAASISAATAEPIRGAGSTFAAPVIGSWANLYKRARADGGDYFTLDWTVDYERVGSLGGLMRLDQPELDFAATDVPVSAAEVAKHGRQQFPFIMGAIAIFVNLEGVAGGALRLDGPVLADIYLGKVRTWSDPAIVALNPSVSLPDLPIAVMHRKDGSGSTFVLTEYLSLVSDEWKTKLGADTLIAWPLGTGAEGTAALIRAVNGTKGAIAYAEFGQVQRAGLPFAMMRNKAGGFVAPGPDGVEAAANSVQWDEPSHFGASMTDVAGEGAYPLTTATFAVVQIAGRSDNRVAMVHDFFGLAFEEGDEAARALGYVPLPDSLVTRIKAYWDTSKSPQN